MAQVEEKEDDNVDVSIITTAVEEDDEHHFDKKIVEEIENTETPPDFADENWSDYVMRQFYDSELENQSPKWIGLVRVAEKLVGPIMSRKVIGFTEPGTHNRHTTMVQVRIAIKVRNETHPLFGDVIEEDGLAEVNHQNTPHPFSLHPGASGSTKAESQALRKILRLRNVVAFEEKAPEDGIGLEEMFLPDEPISLEQINVIDLMCSRTNISVIDFINCGEHKYAFIEQIPSSKAQGMLKYLCEIQSGRQTSPVKKPYDSAWREKNARRMNGESPTEG